MNKSPTPPPDEVTRWLRATWRSHDYSELPYVLADHWAAWGWRQAQQQLAEQVLKDRAGIILGELCAARQLALRCGQDPDAVTPPYLDALRRHYLTTTTTETSDDTD